jgi:hypothetical protein
MVVFPDLWKWFFSIAFLFIVGYLILTFWRLISSLRSGLISLETATYPSIYTFFAVVFLVIFHPFWVVSNHDILKYIRSFFVADYELYLKKLAIQEGFLLENQTDPTMRDYVINRKNLIDKLSGHLQRTHLPYGLYCEPGVSGKGPTKLMVEGYLKRLAQQDMNIQNTLGDENFELWTNTTHRLFSLLCRERSLIDKLIARLKLDTEFDYSFNDIREKISPLLMFYERARVGEDRFRSRKDVNDILNLPIGERDPRNETALVGVNAFTLRTSTYDTGDVPGRPSDMVDARMYMPTAQQFTFGLPSSITGISAIPSPTAITALPTQTNELNVLEWVSNRAIPRINISSRGGNSDN